MVAAPDNCFESWSDELKSRSERVRKLIGPVHWLSDGHHKEEIFRQFLLRHFPSRFRITRGFISTATASAVSHEIDIMVSDSEGELPWFSEGDLVIAPPAAALAQIHVKTEFGVNELSEVMSSGAHNQAVAEAIAKRNRLWFGAVFFAQSKLKKNHDLQRIWKSALLKANKPRAKNPATFPDCIAIIDGPTFLIDKRSLAEKKITVTAYDCGKASPAVFLNDLSDNLPFQGKDFTRRGEWFQMLSAICKGVIFTETYECI